MREKFGEIALGLAIFIVVFAVYQRFEKNIVPGDSMWTAHIAASLAYEGNLDLNEFGSIVNAQGFYATHVVDGKIESLTALGTPILVAPAVWAMGELVEVRDGVDLYALMQEKSVHEPLIVDIQFVLASLATAVAAVGVFVFSRRYLETAGSLLIVIILAFGTSAFSIASRTLWQHSLSLLLVSWLVVLLDRVEKPLVLTVIGFLAGWAYVVRPSNAVIVLVVGVYLLWKFRAKVGWYILGGLVVGLPFIAYSWMRFGEILPFYYGASRVGGNAVFGEAFLGNLVSPARGLFVYSPVLLLSFAGMWLKRRAWTALDSAFLAIIILHSLVIASFPHWWGGHTFGARFWTDVLPFWVWFLIPVLKPVRSGVRVAIGVTVILTIASIGIHWRGVSSNGALQWNSVPVDVDKHPHRLWDWGDLAFLREERGVAARPRPLNITNQSNLNITVNNWQLTHPPVLNPTKQTNPTPEWITIETDFSSDVPTSLGAIAITSDKSTDIIPVTYRPADSPTAYTFDQLNFALPDDISINNTAVSDTKLYALFGEGWYDQEQLGSSKWRWTTEQSTLHIYSSRPQPITLALNITSIATPHTLTIADQSKQIAKPQTMTYSLNLQKHWNIITLNASDSLSGIEGDPRPLSFSIESINLQP